MQKKCSVSKPEHFLNLDQIEEALKVNCAYRMRNIMLKQKASKVSKKDFLNLHHGKEMVEASIAHIKYVTFWFFKEKIMNSNIKCSGVRNNLKNLCMLFGIC